MRLAMNLFTRCSAALLLGALASFPVAASAANPMRPGLWELRVATIVGDKTVPANRSRECISQKDIDHDTRTLPRPSGDCKLSDIERSGNHTTYDLVCQADKATSRGRMDVTMNSDSYDGKVNMVWSGIGNDDVPITIVVHAMRVGDCEK
jgi:hypothetical protein